MKHFRDLAPDAALPSYAGLSFDYEDDGMRVAIDGLIFEMEVSVYCKGMPEGLFEPISVTVKDCDDNEQSFAYVGARERGSVGLKAGVLNAIDHHWERIETWCRDKAEEER